VPRYRYLCKECDNEQIVFHLFDEIPVLKCKMCESADSLEKLITSPLYFKPRSETTNQVVGDVTEEYIEKNREILEEEKQKAKEEVYEPS
jgi:putative FmdB family regulatory protein